MGLGGATTPGRAGPWCGWPVTPSLQYDALTCNFVMVLYFQIEKAICHGSIFHDESSSINHVFSLFSLCNTSIHDGSS
jgi:hypothetical protein